MPQAANILAYVSAFSVLVPIFFFLRRKQKFATVLISVLGILLFVSALSDLLCFIILKMGKPSIPIMNMYLIVEFFLLSWMYHLLLKDKKIIYITIPLFVIFFIYNVLFLQPFTEFQGWLSAVGSIILISYSMAYFLQLLNSLPTVSLFRYSPFWINIAVFYYFGASFLIFLSRNYILKTQSAEFSMTVWSFHNFNNIIKNMVFAVAIYWGEVRQKEE